MRSARLAALIGIASLPFIGASVPANAATCVVGSVASYTTAGFSCDVGGVVSFSNISVSTLTAGAGTVTLGNFSPFIGGGEFGLSLNYIATAFGPGDQADVAWTYTVTALNGYTIHDAFLALAGNTTGDGVARVSEILSNGVTLSLNSPGSTTAEFAPIGVLGVLKDQIDFVPPATACGDRVCAGSSTTSILTNAFSVTQVPIPGAAGLFLTGLGMMGVLGWRRKRSAQTLA
jgi:hypothetical protein